MLSEKLYRAENSSRGTAGRVGAVEGTRSGFSEMVWTVGSTTAGAGNGAMIGGGTVGGWNILDISGT